MQLTQFIRRTLPIFIGFLILWTGLFFYANVLNKSTQHIKRLTPYDADFVVHFQLKDFIKSSVYSLIFNSKDQALLNAMESYVNKKRKGTDDVNDFGIDFLQDITCFSQPYKNGRLYVAVFALNDPQKFDKKSFYLLESNQAVHRKDHVALFATYIGTDKTTSKSIKNKLAQIQLKVYTDKKVAKELYRARFNHFKINNEYTLTKGEIHSKIDENILSLEGTIDLNKSIAQTSNWSLISNGFHVESALVTKAMQDTISAYLKKIGISVGSISRFSLNYYGIEMQDTDKGLIITPSFDILLTFDHDFSFKEVFQDDSYLNEYGFYKENGHIIAGELTYFTDSVDNRTLFVGNHENQLVRRKSATILKIEGETSHITTIKGGGFIVNFINLLPPFKATKDLFSKINHFELSAESKGKKVNLSGVIDMKEGYYLYNEFLRFFLTMQGETVLN